MRSIPSRYIFFVGVMIFSLFTVITYARIGTFEGGTTGAWTGPKMPLPADSMSGVKVPYDKDITNMKCLLPTQIVAPTPTSSPVVGGWA